MRTIPDEVRQVLQERGFALITEPCSLDEFVDLAHALGDVVDDTPVRVVPGKRTYLASPHQIPFHTDHPMADLILWRCESQDDRDGASLLIDGYGVVASLNVATRAWLSALRLPAVVRLGGEALPTGVLSERGDTRGDTPAIFYAPWLEPIERPSEALEALVTFQRALASAEPDARRIRLAPGQILIVDNHRLLHGRSALAPNSTRRLRRLWVRIGRTEAVGRSR